VSRVSLKERCALYHTCASIHPKRLKDVLGTLVRLSETDRPSGIQAEVLRAVQNMVVLLDEQFLVHSAVHRAVLRLLRNCAGDDLQEQLDGKNKVMGAARDAVRGQPSEYEEDCESLHAASHFVHSTSQWSICCAFSAVGYAPIASCL
jgi:hypothetical protein